MVYLRPILPQLLLIATTVLYEVTVDHLGFEQRLINIEDSERNRHQVKLCIVLNIIIYVICVVNSTIDTVLHSNSMYQRADIFWHEPQLSEFAGMRWPLSQRFRLY